MPGWLLLGEGGKGTAGLESSPEFGNGRENSGRRGIKSRGIEGETVEGTSNCINSQLIPRRKGRGGDAAGNRGGGRVGTRAPGWRKEMTGGPRLSVREREGKGASAGCWAEGGSVGPGGARQRGKRNELRPKKEREKVQRKKWFFDLFKNREFK